MFKYQLKVRMATGAPITADLREQISNAARQANASFSALRAGRVWSVAERAAEDGSIAVTLHSPTAVRSPTRSISSIARALVSNSMFEECSAHGRVFDSEVISVSHGGAATPTPAEIIKTATEVLLEVNADPRMQKLADETARGHEKVVSAYIEAKKAMEKGLD